MIAATIFCIHEHVTIIFQEQNYIDILDDVIMFTNRTCFWHLYNRIIVQNFCVSGGTSFPFHSWEQKVGTGPPKKILATRLHVQVYAKQTSDDNRAAHGKKKVWPRDSPREFPTITVPFTKYGHLVRKKLSGTHGIMSPSSCIRKLVDNK